MMRAFCTIHPVGTQADEIVCAVQASGLCKSIDERPILDDLTFGIRGGEYVALLGPNGAGKSTLLKVLGALVPMSRGTLSIFGESIARDGASMRSRIGMIGHGAMLYRELSALENLVFFGRLYDVPNVTARARTMLEEVGLSHRASDPVRTFSRGMVQRAAIARALMHDPDLLLADEPFAGLDAPSRDALETALARLQGLGKTIILANHDIDQSLALAQRALVLRRGRLVVDAPTNGLTRAEVLAEVAAP